ncbi:Acyl-CoA N-acyltransferase [Elaphomyces granulatus]
MARNDQLSSTRPVVDRGVKHVVLDNLLFKTWFHSIYPEELVSKDTDRLYVCRWCFRYTSDVNAYVGHRRLCKLRTMPAGLKVYDHGGYAVWELDGEDHKLFDVTSFLYYILTFTDPDDPGNYYHKQLGKLLMGVSYKLSAWEWEGGFIGGPERPLSEMGRRSYSRFWEERIARYLLLGPPGGNPDEFVQSPVQKKTF